MNIDEEQAQLEAIELVLKESDEAFELAFAQLSCGDAELTVRVADLVGLQEACQFVPTMSRPIVGAVRC